MNLYITLFSCILTVIHSRIIPHKEEKRLLQDDACERIEISNRVGFNEDINGEYFLLSELSDGMPAYFDNDAIYIYWLGEMQLWVIGEAIGSTVVFAFADDGPKTSPELITTDWSIWDEESWVPDPNLTLVCLDDPTIEEEPSPPTPEPPEEPVAPPPAPEEEPSPPTPEEEPAPPPPTPEEEPPPPTPEEEATPPTPEEEPSPTPEEEPSPSPGEEPSPSPEEEPSPTPEDEVAVPPPPEETEGPDSDEETPPSSEEDATPSAEAEEDEDIPPSPEEVGSPSPEEEENPPPPPPPPSEGTPPPPTPPPPTSFDGAQCRSLFGDAETDDDALVQIDMFVDPDDAEILVEVLYDPDELSSLVWACWISRGQPDDQEILFSLGAECEGYHRLEKGDEVSGRDWEESIELIQREDSFLSILTVSQSRGEAFVDVLCDSEQRNKNDFDTFPTIVPPPTPIPSPPIDVAAIFNPTPPTPPSPPIVSDTDETPSTPPTPPSTENTAPTPPSPSFRSKGGRSKQSAPTPKGRDTPSRGTPKSGKDTPSRGDTPGRDTPTRPGPGREADPRNGASSTSPEGRSRTPSPVALRDEVEPAASKNADIVDDDFDDDSVGGGVALLPGAVGDEDGGGTQELGGFS